MKIEPKDLRLGNLINEAVCGVIEVTPSILVDLIKGAENYEGIELTEDWLDKMPQLELGLNGRFWFNGNANEYSIRISKTGGRIYGCGEHSITVIFLHEWQNWFKCLTQTELIFKG